MQLNLYFSLAPSLAWLHLSALLKPDSAPTQLKADGIQELSGGVPGANPPAGKGVKGPGGCHRVGEAEDNVVFAGVPPLLLQGRGAGAAGAPQRQLRPREGGPSSSAVPVCSGQGLRLELVPPEGTAGATAPSLLWHLPFLGR